MDPIGIWITLLKLESMNYFVVCFEIFWNQIQGISTKQTVPYYGMGGTYSLLFSLLICSNPFCKWFWSEVFGCLHRVFSALGTVYFIQPFFDIIKS